MIGFSLADLPTVVGQAKGGVTAYDNFESYNTTVDFLGNQDRGIGWAGPYVTSHANIVSGRLLNGNTEQFVRMSGLCAFARPIYLNPNWQNIRIGMRLMSTHCDASLIGPLIGGIPRNFYFGLCAGTGIMSATPPKHFIGLDWTANQQWIFDSANHNYSLNNGDVLSSAIVNVGGTTTTGNLNFGHSSLYVTNNSPTGSIAQMVILDIIKSGVSGGINQNYTFELFGLDSSIIDNNIDSDQFLVNMNRVPLPVTPNSPTRYISSLNTSFKAISGVVNEPNNGTLDSINCYWNSTGIEFHIYEIAVNRLS